MASSSSGPGDLTLTSIVLFTVGAYGVAAGAATGEQAVVAVGVFAFTLFALGIAWPIATLARLQIDASAPADATVGDETHVRIALRGRAPRVEVRVLDPAGPWLRATIPGGGTVPHTASRRGVFGSVRVQVRTSAPIGVFVRQRTIRVPLATPITVAPFPFAAPPVLRPLPDDAASSPVHAPAHGAGDTVRSVRPYVPGDPARHVHWPTSARRGELVVREQEPPPATGVALVVDLTGPPAAADDAASRAAGIGRSTLAAGGVVMLSTCEATGPVCEFVADARTLGRRLARAIGGPPAAPPDGWQALWIRVDLDAVDSSSPAAAHRIVLRDLRDVRSEAL